MLRSALAVPSPVAAERPLLLRGMFGIGDNIHQRAVLREAMKRGEVYLDTRSTTLVADLVKEGLHIVASPYRKPQRIKERPAPAWLRPVRAPGNARTMQRVTYGRDAIHRHGSILAAMFAEVGLSMPERPDFSIPVDPQWRADARRLIAGRNRSGKPVMVYRPIVLNRVWHCPARAPDPQAYAELFQALRDRFFVVSVADLRQQEWIVGDEQDADLKLHRGELDLEALLGLYAEASLVFGTAGNAGVIAQAVGTPSIIVYGGNERHRTTNAVGEHLALTLAIEPVVPCDCHRGRDGCPKACDKRIDVTAAQVSVERFVQDHVSVKAAPEADVEVRQLPSFGARPRILVFGTTYVDTPERLRLTEHWVTLHRQLNPDCDFLLVDSASPLLWCGDGAPLPGCPKGAEVWSFRDNIGHLSRGGRDGWGRAFCQGLQQAIDGGYDYAVHIEGDSLCRLPVASIVDQMVEHGTQVASVPVHGTKRKEVGWVETGLMFFSVDYLKKSDFIARYDWPNRTVRPTPEKVIFDLLGRDLKMMPWRAERGDKSQITSANVTSLDWVTHCHNNPEVYEKYVRAHADVTEEPGRAYAYPAHADLPAVDEPAPSIEAMVRLNFGCGKNKLPGWANYDAEIDIAKPLPFASAYADFILAEHVMEHVPYLSAYAFLRECRRVLKPGGVLRIAVPSIERAISHADDDYIAFTKRWAPEAGHRGAVRSLIEAHGHACGWTETLLVATLYAAGFDHSKPCAVHESEHAALRGVEGHHKIIGERRNWIETAVCEAW